MISGCSQATVSPSQNKALSAISPSVKSSKNKFMQKSLNRWLKKDWTPIIDKNSTLKMIDKKKDRPFKLQEYVNKTEYYLKHKPKSKQLSNVQKLNKLPVIGTH